MKVVISAGGTGGHIYPALAILNKIKEKEKNSEFLYIGTHNRMEKEIVPNNGIPYESIEIYGFTKNIIRDIKNIGCLIKANKKCKKLIKDFNPDIVIGVGGYVTMPVIKAAHDLGYKTLIHEQNAIPGKTNKYLSKYVTKIAVSFKNSINYLPKEKTVFTGNPCSENAINIKPFNKKDLGLSENRKLVVIVMGSLGSGRVNDYLTKILPLFKNKEYDVIFITGKKYYENIKDMKVDSNIIIKPYIDNLSSVLKVTDVIVSRAGASTLSEIISLNLPSILIPSPYVANNHQYKNAMDLVTKEAAVLIEEKDLDGDVLVKNIDALISNKDKITKIKTNLKSFEITNSATNIYNEIKKIVGNNNEK